MALSFGTRQNVHIGEQHVSLLAEHMGIAKSVSSKVREHIVVCRRHDLITISNQDHKQGRERRVVGTCRLGWIQITVNKLGTTDLKLFIPHDS